MEMAVIFDTRFFRITPFQFIIQLILTACVFLVKTVSSFLLSELEQTGSVYFYPLMLFR